MEALLDATVGAVAGFLAGLLGIGGGFIIVPYLAIRNGVDVPLVTAIASAVLCVLPVCAFSAWSHKAAVGRESQLAALLRSFRLPAALAAATGSLLALALPDGVVAAVFSALVAFSAWSTLSGGAHGLVAHLVPIKRAWLPWLPPAVLIGLGGGVIGAGGGYLTVPYLQSVRLFPTHQAISGSALLTVWTIGGAAVVSLLRALTSALGVAPTSAPDAIATASFDWWRIGVLAAFGVLGAYVGARTCERVNARWLKRLFAIYLLVLSAQMGWRALH